MRSCSYQFGVPTLVFVTCVAIEPARAGSCAPSQLFGNSSAQSFGAATAGGDDFVAVGAPGDSAAGTSAGAVYLFHEQGGALLPLTALRADDAEANSRFGSSLAVSGDVLVTGSMWDDEVASFGGSAYVFRRNGGSWNQEAKLLPPDGLAQDFFGSTVAIDGNLLAVASIGSDSGANGAGSVYVFSFNGSNWVFSTKLVDPQPVVGGRFGHTVGVSGNQVLVGSNSTDRVRVFQNNGSWSLSTTLTAVNPPPTETGFGSGMAIFGSFMAISALHINSHEGVLFLYKRINDTWTFLEQENSPEGLDLGHFGWHLAMDADHLMVAAEVSQRAYIYQRVAEDWRFAEVVLNPDPGANNGFGSMVGLGAGFAIAGADGDETAPDGQGAAYAFSVLQCAPGIPAAGLWGVVVLLLLLMIAGTCISPQFDATYRKKVA